MSSVTNLFIDKSKAPTKDQGIIDIGKNCSYCNQLDFLPFVCEFCKETFCSQHRKIDQHDCINKHKFDQPPSSSRSASPYPPVSSKTLFPDREADKKKIDEKLAKSQIRPTNIVEKLFRVGDVAGNNAFKKFQKFLSLHKSKDKSGRTISKLFGKSSSSSSSNTATAIAKSKYADLALLKKLARGDSKIGVADKLYIWCLYIKNPEDKSINIEKDRKPLYISKNWVVGRSLDSIADNLHIQNINNSTSEANEKLNIFKLDDKDEPKLIPTSIKSSAAFANGDTLYLVRGTI